MLSSEEESISCVRSPRKVNDYRSSLTGKSGSESSSDEEGPRSPVRKTTGLLSAYSMYARSAAKNSKSSFSIPILPGRGERVNQVAGLNQIHVNVSDSVGAFSSKSVSVA